MDELANNYRRYIDYPPSGLHYRGVEDCLRAVPWTLAECVARVTPQGLGRSNIFSKVGILQLCLFGCAPFLGLPEQKIRDIQTRAKKCKVRRPQPKIYECPHRPDLLVGLALELLSYEQRPVYTWPSFQHERHQTMVFFQRVISLLKEKHRRGIPLVDRDLRHRRTSSYIKDIEDMRDFLFRLQEHDDYGAVGSHPRLPHPAEPLYKVALLQGMAQAFRTYRPSRFPQAAIYDALASILQSLKVGVHTTFEVDQSFKVYNEQERPLTADGIKKLLSRHPNPEDRDN